MKKYISIAFLTLFVNLLMASVSLEIQNVDTGAGTLDVYMINDEPVGGFQFELLGIDITDASAPDGFIASTSSTSVLAFSVTGATIPAGEGILTQVTFSDFEGLDICFGEDTGTAGFNAISDASGNYIAADWGDCFIFEEECGAELGDVNGDCELNILDVVILVNIIMDDGEYTEYGDVNDDGYLNILDVVVLVNLILNP